MILRKSVILILVASSINLFGQADTLTSLPSALRKYIYAKKPPQDYYAKIFIITNRKVREHDSTFKYGHGMTRSTPRTFFTAYFYDETVCFVEEEDIIAFKQKMDRQKPVLFYINGHGKNIYQMVNRVWEVEQVYNLNIILFDWPTDNLFLASTIGNAKKSVRNFSRTMNDISDMELSNQKISMIFHSMGNHILKKYVNGEMDDTLPNDYIDNLIISSPAVKYNRHDKWVEEINFAKNVYLTFNNNDKTLQGASILRFHKQLGLGPSKPLVEDINYVDFTPYAGQHHTFFISRNGLFSAAPEIKEFFTDAFNGDIAELSEK